MAELGISGEATAGAGATMASTTGESGFGEKYFGSPARIRTTIHSSKGCSPTEQSVVASRSGLSLRRFARPSFLNRNHLRRLALDLRHAELNCKALVAKGKNGQWLVAFDFARWRER
jgi:hypothetical protein